IEKFCGIPDMKLENLSPVQLGSGFTKAYLKSNDKVKISKRFAADIEQSFDSMSNKEIIIAEGTGHPGVGGIVGLSNAHVGNLIGADILYISGGGIGKALDMLEVDLSYFLYMKSNVRGILFNRLIPDKIATVKEFITEKLLQEMYPGFKNPLSIYGYLPAIEDLPNPSMAVVKKHLKKASVIGDPETEPWHKTCRSIKIISLQEEYLDLEKFLHSGDIVVIAAGSKGRIKKIIEYSNKLSKPIGGLVISCVVAERGLKPDNIKRINKSSIPTLLLEDNTETVERKLFYTFENTKIQLYDNKKIQEIDEMFNEHFQMEKFMEHFLN
ncbi:MAG: AAA family ATPase, partial [Spirochaetales bacterium]|nr:AAA family ATPase [Spirochaetales bacterium]